MSLVFLLPAVLAYEAYAFGWVGQPAIGSARQVENIVAFLLIEEFFALLGAAGRHLPAFALVAMLLGAHLARNDRWRFRPTVLGGMVVESVVWAVPLIVFGWVTARYLPLSANGGRDVALISKCLGAGIYEEMVFRLLGVTVLILTLKDLIKLPNGVVLGLVLLASGVLFSLYHYLSPYEHFRLRTFLFRTVAGGYFALLYMLRGFGITAGSHAAYDLVVVTLLAR